MNVLRDEFFCSRLSLAARGLAVDKIGAPASDALPAVAGPGRVAPDGRLAA